MPEAEKFANALRPLVSVFRQVKRRLAINIMKKILPLILILNLAIAAVSGIVLASAIDNPGFTMSIADAVAGEEFTAELGISNNPGIITLRLNIEYDPEKLELIAVEDTKLLGGFSQQLLPLPSVKSPYILMWIDSNAIENNTSSGTIAILTFRLISGDGASVSINYLDAYSKDAEEITFSTINKQSVPITETTESASQSTKPTTTTEPSSSTQPSTKPTEPSSSTKPSAKPTEPSSSTQPSTKPTEPPSSTKPSTKSTEPSSAVPSSTEVSDTYLLGDADQDGKITVKDATVVQKHVAKILKLEGKAEKAADADEDTKVSVKDATRIQKHVAKIKVPNSRVGERLPYTG